jgi:hypothetical protein
MTAVPASTPRTRRSRKAFFIALTTLSFIPYFVSVVADMLVPANLFWLTALSMLAIFAGAIGWARALDEGAMSAHYIAWYWGGSLGLAVSAMTYMALAPALFTGVSIDKLLTDVLGAPLPNAGFHAGFMLAILPALIGYLAWWAIVWLRRGG